MGHSVSARLWFRAPMLFDDAAEICHGTLCKIRRLSNAMVNEPKASENAWLYVHPPTPEVARFTVIEYLHALHSVSLIRSSAGRLPPAGLRRASAAGPEPEHRPGSFVHRHYGLGGGQQGWGGRLAGGHRLRTGHGLGIIFFGVSMSSVFRHSSRSIPTWPPRAWPNRRPAP